MHVAINFFIFNSFFNMNFFYEFIVKVLNIVMLDQNKNMNMLYMKRMPKFEQDDQKKLLDGCS